MPKSGGEPWIVVSGHASPNAGMKCEGCGELGQVDVPVNIPTLVKATNDFRRKHKACKAAWQAKTATHAEFHND